MIWIVQMSSQQRDIELTRIQSIFDLIDINKVFKLSFGIKVLVKDVSQIIISGQIQGVDMSKHHNHYVLVII